MPRPCDPGPGRLRARHPQPHRSPADRRAGPRCPAAAARPADDGGIRRRPAAHGRRRRGGAVRAGHRRRRPAAAVRRLSRARRHRRRRGRSPTRAVAARPLGPDPRLVEVLRDRLVQAGADPADPRTAVVLAAAGSSDVRAVADVESTAELLQRGWAGPVSTGYGSAATPTVPDAVAAARPAGAEPGGRRLLPARAGPLPRQAGRGGRGLRSPLPCCPTTGSPPSCSTATTPRSA